MKEEENREYKVGDLVDIPGYGKCIVLEAEQRTPKEYRVKVYSLTRDRTAILSWWQDGFKG